MPNISTEVVNHNNMNDIYKCHFCPRNIKLHNIDKHFKIFHKFGHSDTEYYCEFCDSQEAFLTRDNLLEHIHSVQHIAEKAIPESKMESLDEGKSKFLHLMTNFESQKDAVNFLFWIKCNDTKTFLDNHEIENDEFQVQDDFEENEDQTMSGKDFIYSNSLIIEFGEKIASKEAIFPQEKNFEDDFDDESNVKTLDDEIIDADLVTKNSPEIFQKEFYNKDSKESIENTETELIALLDYAIASDNENENSEDHIKSENFRDKIQESVNENTEKMFDEKFYHSDAAIDLEHAIPHEENLNQETIFEDDFNEESRETDDDIVDSNSEAKFNDDYYSTHLMDINLRKIVKNEIDNRNITEDSSQKNTDFNSLSVNDDHLDLVKKTKLKLRKKKKDHKEYKCEYCEKLFTKAGSLKTLINIVHEEHKGYKCTACGHSFFQQVALKKHIGMFHDGHKNYKNDSCGESFSEPGNLKKHFRTIHEQYEQHKEYKCEYGDKSFNHSSDWSNHRNRIHKDHKNHKCESCGKSFFQAERLKTHIYINHVEVYKCESCGKSFSKAGSLGNHITEIHEGIKNFQCEFCSHKTNRRCELKEHIKCVHDKIKEHQCKFCGKYYPRKAYLRRHIHSVHEGYKNHKCDSCNISFSRSDLKKHIHIFHGNKYHKCESCGKSFTGAQYLKKHIHNGCYKDHKCYTCGKSFSSPEYLKKHSFTIHESHKE